MNTEPVVSTHNLCRSFGVTRAVNNLTLEVPQESVFGLIGPNGSGKTTAIRLILGLLEPDSGESVVFGEPSPELRSRTRQRIGYLTEEPLPFGSQSVDALLKYISCFFDHWDWDYAKRERRRFDIPGDKPLDQLSFGQRRRAELLLVLAQKPDLLILDDPTIGLDASVRRDFLYTALEAAQEEGRTVLFTSHVLHDVERVVDRVGIITSGSMDEVAELDDLKTRTKRLVLRADANEADIPGLVSCHRNGTLLFAVTSRFDQELATSLRARYGELEVEDINLEDIFLAHAMRDQQRGAVH